MKRTVPVIMLLAAAVLLPSVTALSAPAKDESGFVFIPMGFYTPETSVALGLSALFVLPQNGSSNAAADTRRTGNINTLLILTARKQISLFTVADWYSPDRSWNLNGGIYFRYFPDDFYGTGNDTADVDRSGFTEQSFRSELLVRRRIAGRLHAGLRYSFEDNRVRDPESGGALDDPLLQGRDGCRLGSLGLEVDWDSRDNNFAPQRGVWFQAGLARYARWLGSGWQYSRGWVDLRGYLPLRDGHTLALQGLVQFSNGEQPWQGLQQLGGSKLLRGYYQGRYRDRQLALFQTEYRFRIWNRWGGVVFGGIGQVADRPGQFAADRFHWSAGAGIRFRIRDRINMRLDVGAGEQGAAFYVLALEAF